MGFLCHNDKTGTGGIFQESCCWKSPLNKITINDITEDCGVNRMTFYYHFKDIYDLVDWIMVEDARQAMEGRKDIDDWDKAFLDVLLKNSGE
mgnify:CR=1 FL=1